MGEVIRFPEGAISNVSHLATNVLIRLFHEWNGIDCDAKGVDSVKGYSVRAIQDEVNRRGYGGKIAV